MNNMTYFKYSKFFLLFLFFNQVFSEEPIPYFSSEGMEFDFGYCFKENYVVVYKSGPGGDQLLGNSSNMSLTETLPPSLHGRIQLDQEILLGFQLINLTELDSGAYRKECWSNQSIVSQQTKYLQVCNQEFPLEEIVLNEEGGAELFCNNRSTSRAGVSVRWYYETFQDHNRVLFFDGKVSMKFLSEDLKGDMEIKNNGMVLVLDKIAIKSYSQFYCLLFEDEKCLGFQNMYQVDSSEIKLVFATEQNREVLQCNPKGKDWLWETPLGEFNKTNMIGNQMYVSNFSLVIPTVANMLSGVYTCSSPLPDIQYVLLLCNETKFGKKDGVKGQNVSLECSFPSDASKNVIWYRHGQSERYEIFSDSDDHGVPIPEELKGRLTLSHYEFILNISEVDMTDAGVYGCAVLTNNFIDGENTTNDENDDSFDEMSENWGNEINENCLFKQEIILKVVDPPKTNNITGIVVGVGVLVLIVIVVVVVLKKKGILNENYPY